MTTAFFSALLMTVVLLSFVLRPLFVRLDLVDVPNARSSHTEPVLRGGGLAIALGVGLALLIAGVVESSSALALLAVSAGFAALGFADDHRSRSVKMRMLAQLGLAVAAAILLARDVNVSSALTALAVLGTVFWIVGFVNAFNFMDGINGISAITGTVAGVMYVVVGSQLDNDLLAVGGAALAGGALGFLPFNFPAAKFFAGDVGSYFLGSYIAILTVVGLIAGTSVVTAAAPVMLYLLDTSVTLVRRTRKGARIWDAHREHSYQHLANIRLNHTRTSLLVAVITGLCAALGVLAHDRSGVVVVVLGAGIVLLALGFISLPLVLVDRRSVPRTAA